MTDTYGDTFRALPLTPDQLREVEHYIHTRQRSGLDYDTPELAAMLNDMLNPPERSDDDESMQDSVAAERAVAENEESDKFDLLKGERDRQH